MNLMPWELCERDFIKIVERDDERLRTIIKMALKRLDKIKKYGKDEEISFVVEDYYEIIKELLVAYLLKNRLRSKNHQCLISYFYKKNPQCEREVQIISQMSFFRNRLNYYGEEIPQKFYETHKQEFKEVIKLLLGILEVKK